MVDEGAEMAQDSRNCLIEQVCGSVIVGVSAMLQAVLGGRGAGNRDLQHSCYKV